MRQQYDNGIDPYDPEQGNGGGYGGGGATGGFPFHQYQQGGFNFPGGFPFGAGGGGSPGGGRGSHQFKFQF